MKKIVSLTSVLIIFLLRCSYGQQLPMTARQRQSWEQRGDSAIADRGVQRMKQVFSVTPEQEQALFSAGIQISHQRREVYKQYGQTDSYAAEVVKVDSAAGVTYITIVGAANYQLYKDALHSRLLTTRQLLRQPVSGDSLNLKNQQP